MSSLKAFILTDMEGVAGVMNFDDYVSSPGRYYELGKHLTTMETNAAIEGILEAGATEVVVLDGHGSGAINILELHKEAKLIRGYPGYPFGLDESYGAMLIIGQHAKAQTPNAHLCHTQSLAFADFTINGLSIGEMGANMAVAGYFDIPTVMVSGDEAACEEALALVPNMETAAVKKGYSQLGALHLQPKKARDLIKAKARKGVERLSEIKPYKIEPPYEMVSTYFPKGGETEHRAKRSTGKDLIEVLNRAY